MMKFDTYRLNYRKNMREYSRIFKNIFQIIVMIDDNDNDGNFTSTL